MKLILSPDDWCLLTGITVLDPDGWDRKNFQVDWAKLLTFQEFMDKVSESTTYLHASREVIAQKVNQKLAEGWLNVS